MVALLADGVVDTRAGDDLVVVSVLPSWPPGSSGSAGQIGNLVPKITFLNFRLLSISMQYSCQVVIGQL